MDLRRQHNSSPFRDLFHELEGLKKVGRIIKGVGCKGSYLAWAHFPQNSMEVDKLVPGLCHLGGPGKSLRTMQKSHM